MICKSIQKISEKKKLASKTCDSLYWTRLSQNDLGPPGYDAWTLDGWNGPVFKNIQKRLGYYNKGPKTVTLFFWWRHRGPWSQPRRAHGQRPLGYIEDMSPLPYPGGHWYPLTIAPEPGPGQCQKRGSKMGGVIFAKKSKKKNQNFQKKRSFYRRDCSKNRTWKKVSFYRRDCSKNSTFLGYFRKIFWKKRAKTGVFQTLRDPHLLKS